MPSEITFLLESPQGSPRLPLFTPDFDGSLQLLTVHSSFVPLSLK